jgi:olefin beta-lactone synthetase
MMRKHSETPDGSSGDKRKSGDDTLNIAHRLKQMSRRLPFKRAVVYPAARDRNGRVAYAHYTFDQLEKESDRIAHGLTAAGIGRGIRTVLMVRPSLDFFALIFAIFKCGAVPVVVDPGMGLSRMVSCFRESDPAAFIGIPPAHVLRVLFPGYFRSVKKWITVGKRWFWGGQTLENLRRDPWRPYTSPPTRQDETAAILFTTGSTGPAKGVVYTHGNFDAQILHIQKHFHIAEDEIDLPTFPLFALFDPALGMTAVIPDMDPTRPALVDPTKIIEAINDHGVTNMFASPALLHRVGGYCQKHGIQFPTLRRVVSAGAPVYPDNIDRFAKLLGPHAEIHTPYGATEAVPVISIGSREILSETRQKTEQGFGICVGRPIYGSDVAVIRISDDPISRWTDDLLVADGEIGEIAVRGNLVTKSYFRRPESDKLAKIPFRDGFWHRMGDLGWRDSKDRIWFCGRKNHRVQTSSGTLFTIPCESIFNQHPAIFRTALVGIGRPGEQIPVICVERYPGDNRIHRRQLRRELTELAQNSVVTRDIRLFLFPRKFPVDIRHNSKIFREKLSRWAEKKIRIPAAESQPRIKKKTG